MNNRYQDADFDVPKRSAQNRPASKTSTGANGRYPSQRNIRPYNQTVQNRGGQIALAQKKRAVAATPKKHGVIMTAVIKSVRQVILPLFFTEEKKMSTVKVEKKPLPINVLLISLLCTLFIAAMIFSYIQINEYTVQVSELRSTVSELMSEDKELSSALEQKNDMAVIEQKAQELGMVKADRLTKKHINLTNEDKVEVIETDSSEDESIVTTIMSGILSNFDGLSDYFN